MTDALVTGLAADAAECDVGLLLRSWFRRNAALLRLIDAWDRDSLKSLAAGMVDGPDAGVGMAEAVVEGMAADEYDEFVTVIDHAVEALFLKAATQLVEGARALDVADGDIELAVTPELIVYAARGMDR